MWIFTNKGFISAVEHHHDNKVMYVRARSAEHLQAIFPGEDIIRIETADYRFRVFVPREVFVETMTEQLASID